MAIAVIADNPSGDAQSDAAIQQRLNLGNEPPSGAVIRIAGEFEGGWRVISVWESEEAFNTFRRERLEPALREAGRQIPNFRIWQLDSVRIAGQQR